jgi:formate/nitrite transporter FocA (FNT family)
MKEMKKMTKAEVIYFLLMAFSSGVVIGIGGVSSLLANNIYGAAGKLIGAALFTVGIYSIVMFEMKLFTGMVASIPKMGMKNMWQLPACFFGNIVGVGVVALLAYFSPVKDYAIPQAQALMQGKLNAEFWYLRAFCSSILCGALITLSVWSVKYAPKKSLSASVGVIFPIIVFAFCGFDHSVANMLYFYYLGSWSWKIIPYCLLSIAGNVVGGVILPLIYLLKERINAQ